MNKLSLLYTIAIIIGISGTSCHQNKQGDESGNLSMKADTSASFKSQSITGLVMLADTITYDVTLYNINQEDPYTDRFLKNIKPEVLINSVFESVYSGKIKAYDIFTNLEMPINKIKELEKVKGFSRSKIGKIQFTETWRMNPVSLSIEKKVIAMAFGYAHSDSKEGIVAYDKPLFRVYIK